MALDPDNPALHPAPSRTPSHAQPDPQAPAPDEPRWQWLSPTSAWLGFQRLTQIGWPRNFPIVQFPNAPLIIAFLAGQAAVRTPNPSHADAVAISYLAMTIWAYEELFHGVNWFRHALGLGYGISTVVHLALALQH
jgi:hypothetical protein